MTRFKLRSMVRNENVHAAIALANLVTSLDVFYQRIRDRDRPFDPRFTSPSATPRAVAEELRNSTLTVSVRVEKHRRRRVLGWTLIGSPDVVYLNSKALGRPTIEIAATLVHEWVHAVDDLSPLDFHHGKNDPSGKDDTAPYAIDRLAREILSQGAAAWALAEADDEPWEFLERKPMPLKTEAEVFGEE